MGCSVVFRRCLALIILTLYGTSFANGIQYIVTAPNTIRYGVQETIGISISQHGSPVDVQVYLQDNPGQKKIISPKNLVQIQVGDPVVTTVTLNPNDIPEPDRNKTDLKVYLVVKGSKGEFEKKILVPVTKYSGYAFIQTDKPVYLPNQQVLIRVFYMDEKLLPHKDRFTLEVMNPQKTRVLYKEFKPDVTGISEALFKFPAHPMFGNWTIIVHYGFQHAARSTVQFEVKEYTLPTFSVNIQPPGVILSTDATIRGQVNAQYVYGKPVHGVVNITHEIKMKTGLRVLIGMRRGVKLDPPGVYKYIINVANDMKKRGLPWFPNIEGAVLITTAEVIEEATGNKEVTVDESSIFATSRYAIAFPRTLKDFKPGVPYQVQVDVHLANGQEPNDNILVNVESALAMRKGVPPRPLKIPQIASTDARGRVMFEFNTDQSDEELRITVKTADPTLLGENQATGEVKIDTYKSAVPGNYVWIAAPNDDITFQVGKTFSTGVMMYPKVAKLHFMVVSAGAIVYFNVTEGLGGSVFQTVQFQVTPEMAPSARLIVFYVNNNRFISDSIVLDVERTCRYNNGKPLRMEAHTTSGFVAPGGNVNLRIFGEPKSHVGIAAVDEAVLLINRKHRLTYDKLFEEIESHDLGCGPGGGENTEAVFRNAGILVMSNAVINDHSRSENGCQYKKRTKRDIDSDDDDDNNGTSINEAMEEVRNKIQGYFGEARICCRVGMMDGPEGMDCLERAQLINETMGEKYNCWQAFLDCCQMNLEFKEVYTSLARSVGIYNDNGYDRTGQEMIDLYERETLKAIRQYFPETWLFNIFQIGGKGCSVSKDPTLCEIKATAPHSITTWNVQAIGVSETTGMCVAEPLHVRVFKSLFIQMQLPYAAVRGEQIEVPATIFNYGDTDLEVTVYMFGVEGICMGAGPGERSERRIVRVNANSAQTVTFPVMPLQVTEYNLRVVALSVEGTDAVEKKLRVVPEGIEEEMTFPVFLDPSGFYKRKRRNAIEGILEEYDERLQKQTVTVDVTLPDNHIPGTGKCVLSVLGDVVAGPAISTNLAGVEQSFIRLPTGCGEQTMIGMAPLVYTMLYLKRTNKVTPSAEQNGYSFMQQGYNKQLTYRKPDGSFAVWANYASSTWLTAFVARVFCQAETFIQVSNDVTCQAVKWLASKQNNDGSFREDYVVHHREMTGSITGAVTLSAFVLIGIQECHQCNTDVKQTAVNRAVTFLETNLPTLRGPFEVSITAYALSLANSLKAKDAMEKLKSLAIFDENLNTRYWNVDGSEFNKGKTPWVYQTRPAAVAVESSSYALLALLLYDEIEYSHPIVNWLNQQRSASGSFVSTQDTVVALQALAEYTVKANIPRLDMVCNVTSSQTSRAKRSFVIKENNALLLQEAEMPPGGKLVMSVGGKGVANMLATLYYNVEQRPEETCKFELEIKTSEEVDQVKAAMRPQPELDEVYNVFPEPVVRSIISDDEKRKLNYDVDDNDDKKKEVDKGRPKGVIPENSRHLIVLDICVRYLGDRPAGMSILDVGLFTGYRPIEKDLSILAGRNRKLSKVSSFEVSNRTVVLYLEEVPNKEKLCVRFRTVQEIRVGKIQTTSVKVYDYYEPDKVCTKFYRPDNDSPMLRTICEGKQCVCIQGQCPKCAAFADLYNMSPKQQFAELVNMGCDKYNFVWNGTLTNIHMEGSFKILDFEINHVFKEGIEKRDDVEGTMVSFSSLEACNCTDIKVGEQYIIMANDGFQYKTKEGLIRQKYMVDKSTRIYNTKPLKKFQNRSKEQTLQKAINQLYSRFVVRGEGCPK